MAKGNSLSAGMLKLVFQAVAMANIADNTATSPNTNLFVSLHTGDPLATGNQTSSEISYTGYARVTVARTTGGWAISGQTITPVATIIFPASTGGAGGTVTFFGIGTALSGAGVLLYSGAVSPTIAVANGVTPELTTASTIVET